MVRLVYIRNGLFGACEYHFIYAFCCTSYSRNSAAIQPQRSRVGDLQIQAHSASHEQHPLSNPSPLTENNDGNILPSPHLYLSYRPPGVLNSGRVVDFPHAKQDTHSAVSAKQYISAPSFDQCDPAEQLA